MYTVFEQTGDYFEIIDVESRKKQENAFVTEISERISWKNLDVVVINKWEL